MGLLSETCLNELLMDGSLRCSTATTAIVSYTWDAGITYKLWNKGATNVWLAHRDAVRRPDSELIRELFLPTPLRKLTGGQMKMWATILKGKTSNPSPEQELGAISSDPAQDRRIWVTSIKSTANKFGDAGSLWQLTRIEMPVDVYIIGAAIYPARTILNLPQGNPNRFWFKKTALCGDYFLNFINILV